MNNNLRNFGLVCGGIAGLAGVAGGAVIMMQAGEASWLWGLGLFCIGMGFFAGPALVVLTLANTPGEISAPKTKAKTTGKKTEIRKTQPKTAKETAAAAGAKGETAEEAGPVTIYAGNLPLEAGESELRSMFEVFGTVDSVRVITHRGGKSKGYGFIDMPNREEALAAIEALNGKDFSGRKLKVSESRAKGKRGGRGKRNDRPRKSEPRSQQSKPEQRNSKPEPQAEEKQEPSIIDWDASPEEDDK